MTRGREWHAERALADTEEFGRARDFLMNNYHDPSAAARFHWPRASLFNWALDWFDHVADGNSDIAVAGADLGGRWREITYDELSYASDGVAHRLRARGVRPGDRVVIESDSVCELWAALIGILKCGAVCVPIHFGLHPEQFAIRLAGAVPAALVTSAPERVRSGVRTVDLADLVAWDDRVEFDPGPRRGADLAAFGCFTSGTTGAPKLALHSHRTHGIGHLSSLFWSQLGPGRRHLNISSPGWAKFFWSSLLVPLTAGATVVVWPARKSAADVRAFAEAAAVDSMCAPAVVLRNLDTGQPRPPRLTEITSVGESLDQRTRERVARDWEIGVRVGFGQTEATAILGEFPGSPGRFEVLPGYEVRLHQTPDAPARQLQFRSFSGGSFLGYDRQGELLPPVLDAAGWQWTGDYADGSLTDGSIRLLGRGDEVYKSNGHLVSPFRIEAILEGHPLVAEAAVTPVPDPDAGFASHAFIVLAEPAPTAALDAIRTWVNSRLEPEVALRSVYSVPALPRSVNGKVQRKLLGATT
ncbi:AMP-binding protein [Nocardia sp. NPDC055321]